MWAKITLIIEAIQPIAFIIKNLKQIWHDSNDQIITAKTKAKDKKRKEITDKLDKAKDLTDEEIIELHRKLRKLESN